MLLLRLLWPILHQRLFSLLTYNPWRSHTDKSEKSGRVWKWNGGLGRERPSHNPLGLELVPILSSVFFIHKKPYVLHMYIVRAVCHPNEPSGDWEGVFFLQNVYPDVQQKQTTRYWRHQIVELSPDFIITTVSITLRIFTNSVTLTENRQWLGSSLGRQILTSQNSAHDCRSRVTRSKNRPYGLKLHFSQWKI